VIVHKVPPITYDVTHKDGVAVRQSTESSVALELLQQKERGAKFLWCCLKNSKFVF
jgi:hypothetical protein